MAVFIPTSRFATDPNAPRTVPEKGDRDFNPIMTAASLLQFGNALGETIGKVYDSRNKGMLFELSGNNKGMDPQQAVNQVLGPDQTPVLAQATQEQQPQQSPMAVLDNAAQEVQRRPLTSGYYGDRGMGPSGPAMDSGPIMDVVRLMPENDKRALAQMVQVYSQNPQSQEPYNIALDATNNPPKARRMATIAQKLVGRQQMGYQGEVPYAQTQETPAQQQASAPNQPVQPIGTTPAPQVQAQTQAAPQSMAEQPQSPVDAITELWDRTFGSAEGDDGSVFDNASASYYMDDQQWTKGLHDVRGAAQLSIFARNANTPQRQWQVTEIARLLAPKTSEWSNPNEKEEFAAKFVSLFPQIKSDIMFNLDRGVKMADIGSKRTTSIKNLTSANKNMVDANATQTMLPERVDSERALTAQRLAVGEKATDETRRAKDMHPLKMNSEKASAAADWALAWKRRQPTQTAGSAELNPTKANMESVEGVLKVVEGGLEDARKYSAKLKDLLHTGKIKYGKTESFITADSEITPSIQDAIKRADDWIIKAQETISSLNNTKRQVQAGVPLEQINPSFATPEGYEQTINDILKSLGTFDVSFVPDVQINTRDE